MTPACCPGKPSRAGCLSSGALDTQPAANKHLHMLVPGSDRDKSKPVTSETSDFGTGGAKVSPSTQGDKGVAGPAQQQGTRSPGWGVGGRKARGSQEGWLRRSPGHLLRGRNEDRSGGGPGCVGISEFHTLLHAQKGCQQHRQEDSHAGSGRQLLTSQRSLLGERQLVK